MEQRDDLQRKLLSLENALSTARHQEVGHTRVQSLNFSEIFPCITVLRKELQTGSILLVVLHSFNGLCVFSTLPLCYCTCDSVCRNQVLPKFTYV